MALRRAARLLAGDGVDDRRDVVGGGAAAAADDVDEPGVGELAERRRRLLGRLVVAAEGVGQPGVGVGAHERIGDRRQLVDVRPHLLAAERAVEPDRERIGMPHRLPERSDGLPGQRASGAIGDRARDHERCDDTGVGGVAAGGDDRCLGVERVEDRLDEQQIDPAGDEPGDLLAVGLGEVVERHRPVAGVFHTRRQRERDVGRADGARHPPLAPVCKSGGIGGASRQPGAGDVDLVDQGRVAEPVLALGDGGRRERVGGDDVGTGRQVPGVQIEHGVGLGQHEQVEVSCERLCVIAEAIAADVGLVEAQRLDLAAAGAVEHEDPRGGGSTKGVWLVHACTGCSRSHTASTSSARLRV